MRRDACRKTATDTVYLYKQETSPASTQQEPHAEYMRPHVIKNASSGQLHLQMASDFARGMIAELPATMGIFNCNVVYFCLQLRIFLTAMARIFASNCEYFCL